jgi:hypothetical protein
MLVVGLIISIVAATAEGTISTVLFAAGLLLLVGGAWWCWIVPAGDSMDTPREPRKGTDS